MGPELGIESASKKTGVFDRFLDERQKKTSFPENFRLTFPSFSFSDFTVSKKKGPDAAMFWSGDLRKIEKKTLKKKVLAPKVKNRTAQWVNVI